jgi:hypothetical protein
VIALARAAALAVCLLSLAWAAWIGIFGGFDRTLAGIRVRSNNPERVLLISAIALIGYLAAGGTVPASRAAAGLRRSLRALSERPHRVAAAIAVAAAVLAVVNSTRIAGGADAYGYVSQADLWLAGDLKVPQPWVARVPWPNAAWTFTPLGYRPVESEWAIVPTYSPGLPMLMAAAKLVGGQCAMFAVVPACLGIATLATFGIGRRLGSSAAGLAGSWLVATSPVVLEVSLESLTDVPVMAGWSVAFYFLLGGGLPHALAAGLSAAIAILIRPNLVPLVLPMAAWYFLRRSTSRPRLLHAGAFAAGVLPGIAGVASINQWLYGSALTSGYGSLSDAFAWGHVLPNTGRFLTWIVQTQTPLAVLGLAALVVPLRRIWPAVDDRRVFIAIGLFLAILWAQYAAYLVFDSAGYLRFLLPGWPFMLVGLGAVIAAVSRANGTLRWVAVAVTIALGAWNIRVAVERSVFEQRQAARHEAPIGRLVRSHTPENSVVLAVHRSGSLRYYAGRTTLRYDMLDGDWLDRAVAWLQDRGVRVYAVLDERETREAKQRFAGQQRAAAFDRPMLVYAPASTALYDLTAPAGDGPPPVVIADPLPDLAGCDPPRTSNVELRTSNVERRTSNVERRTTNHEPRTARTVEP